MAASGFTLIEVMVAVAIIGILAVLGGVRFTEWMENQRTRAAARSAADAMLLARAEAIRTGNNHIVFFGPPGSTDGNGTPFTDGAGNVVPLLVLNDGPPATANCQIDNGEPTEAVPPVEDVGWGVTEATVKVPDDNGGVAFVAPQSSGATFGDPANNPVNWVMFRPDGVPVAFEWDAGACGDVGGTGSGGGALYITNGTRDFAIVLSPLGGVRVHLWNPQGAWSG